MIARVPRVCCAEHKVRQVALPWARERSGFTLLFEALVMALVGEMPVASVAGLIGEEDKRVWRVVHHYVDRAVEAQDLSGENDGLIWPHCDGLIWPHLPSERDRTVRAFRSTNWRSQEGWPEWSCLRGLLSAV